MRPYLGKDNTFAEPTFKQYSPIRRYMVLEISAKQLSSSSRKLSESKVKPTLRSSGSYNNLHETEHLRKGPKHHTSKDLFSNSKSKEEDRNDSRLLLDKMHRQHFEAEQLNKDFETYLSEHQVHNKLLSKISRTFEIDQDTRAEYNSTIEPASDSIEW